MKLTSENIAVIESIISTARLIDIENIIIEPNKIRAIDDNRTVLIFQDKDVPEFEFGTIAFNRLSTFQNRLTAIRSLGDFDIDASVDNTFVKSLTLRTKGTKVDYRCANPATVKAPGKINEVLGYSIEIPDDLLSIIQKSYTAMNGNHIAFAYNGEEVSFTVQDMNGDAFTHTITSNINVLEENAPKSFNNKYPIKTIMALFKKSDNRFNIGMNGMLNVVVNGINIFVIPQVG